jgi:hypothetical protein
MQADGGNLYLARSALAFLEHIITYYNSDEADTPPNDFGFGLSTILRYIEDEIIAAENQIEEWGKRKEGRKMAKLNLNFHKQTGCHNPTKHEIVQIGSIAFGVEAIIKALGEYAERDHEDLGSVCMSVCSALELLIEPVCDYLSNYAGDAPDPEEAEETA